MCVHLLLIIITKVIVISNLNDHTNTMTRILNKNKIPSEKSTHKHAAKKTNATNINEALMSYQMMRI